MHDFHEDIRKRGPHSAWLGGKTIDFVLENGCEVELCLTNGESARFQWVDDNGEPIKGKLRCKSLGMHIRAKAAILKCP